MYGHKFQLLIRFIFMILIGSIRSVDPSYSPINNISNMNFKFGQLLFILIDL